MTCRADIADMGATSELNVWVMSTTAQPQQDMKRNTASVFARQPAFACQRHRPQLGSLGAKINTSSRFRGAGARCGGTRQHMGCQYFVEECDGSCARGSLRPWVVGFAGTLGSTHLYRDEAGSMLCLGTAVLALLLSDCWFQAGRNSCRGCIRQLG